MKKILLGIIVMILLFLSGCSEPQVVDYDNQITEIEAQLILLDEQLIILQNDLNSLQGEFNTHNHEQLIDLQNQIDELKLLLKETEKLFYGFDNLGNFITIEQLGQLLEQKYFNGYSSGLSEYYYRDEYLRLEFRLNPTILNDLSREEIFALEIMLMNEMGVYELYTATKDDVQFVFYFDTIERNSFSINSSLFSLVDLSPKVLINNAFNTYSYFLTQTPDIELTEQHLAEYINSGVYDDFVLTLEE